MAIAALGLVYFINIPPLVRMSAVASHCAINHMQQAVLIDLRNIYAKKIPPPYIEVNVNLPFTELIYG